MRSYRSTHKHIQISINHILTRLPDHRKQGSCPFGQRLNFRLQRQFGVPFRYPVDILQAVDHEIDARVAPLHALELRARTTRISTRQKDICAELFQKALGQPGCIQQP